MFTTFPSYKNINKAWYVGRQNAFYPSIYVRKEKMEEEDYTLIWVCLSVKISVKLKILKNTHSFTFWLSPSELP